MTDRDAVPLDLASMRKHYRTEGLSETDLAATPVEQFARWFAQAAREGGLFEPNAMIVSTADAAGRPSSRTGAAQALRRGRVRLLHELRVPQGP
ncbi:pyridoxine/pyridoxamine 5'-phosphate oxidase [Streptomyces albogriseolus]|uniref:Pyridoxine/pyridoxamine 5'-phosphate oxidase n=1 Tax=Streptomyces albogriseolus TaxID=1887 RepID=A0ACC6UMI4_STRAO